MRRKVRILAIAGFLSGLMTLAFVSAGTSAQSGDQQKPANPCNPCSKTKPQNPCNPCSPKKPANPCNPCGQKKPANPCNPCGEKKPANPCNPCGGTAASSEIYQPAVEYSAWLKINQKPILSQGHGGVFVTTFANPTAQEAIKSKTTSFPVGSVLVKESFADNAGKPGAKATIFGMEKTGDGWLWVTTDSSGHITGKGNSAQMQMCAQCHSAAKRDSAYLRKK